MKFYPLDSAQRSEGLLQSLTYNSFDFPSHLIITLLGFVGKKRIKRVARNGRLTLKELELQVFATELRV